MRDLERIAGTGEGNQTSTTSGGSAGWRSVRVGPVGSRSQSTKATPALNYRAEFVTCVIPDTTPRSVRVLYSGSGLDNGKTSIGVTSVIAKRVPNLAWPSWIFRDADAAELMAEEDADLFAEETDVTALIEILVPAGGRPSVVRYHYPEASGAFHA